MKHDIVLTLHAKHINDNHKMEEHRFSCPMCEYAYRESYNYWMAVLEETMLPLVKEHEARWEQDGVMIGNASSPASDILHELLTHWIHLPRVHVPDSPEMYYDHPIVVELYEKELAKK